MTPPAPIVAPPGAPIVTRFAPSPTGYLHLGHAYSALFTAEQAAGTGLPSVRLREAGEARTGAQKGRLLLRIEDIDTPRVKPEFEDAIYEDLAWLGLSWETPVRRQSEHFDEYRAGLDKLDARGLLYPCFCSRREIRAEIEQSGAAPHAPPNSPEGPLYPGTCRKLTMDERKSREAEGRPFALRLDSAKAIEIAEKTTGPLIWSDAEKGDVEATLDRLGDVVLARKDTPVSYHLAVTIDDHLQGVTLVTRGEDLFPSTHVHRVLQALLGLDTPRYHHHRLLTGDDGEHLAKRKQSTPIRSLREAGKTPEEVRALAGFKHWRPSP